VDANSAYSGAIYGTDGWGASSASFGNLIRATAEINESIFPTRHEYHDLEPDTGGPGRWRGMPGSRYVKRVTAPTALFTYQIGMKHPMPGVAGGRPGGPNRFTIRPGQPDAERVTHTAAMAPLRAGDAIEWKYGGGGGWGDPYEREPEKVIDDVLDELVSMEGARRDYGVAVNGSGDDLAIDWTETERLRKARLAPSS